MKIAHVSDLHTSGFGRREQALAAQLSLEKPDLIVVTGDTVVDGSLADDLLGQRPAPREDPKAYAQAAEVLRHFHAPLGVWVVRGNWENVRRIPDERAYYARNGVGLLLNEAVEVRHGLWLVGLDDACMGTPDLAAAAGAVKSNGFVIALFHSPAYFDAMAGRWPLALAGHTHGGQVWLPFLTRWWLPEGSGSYLAGWYESSGSRMYVSRGLGTSDLPIRFLSRPELALITVGHAAR